MQKVLLVILMLGLWGCNNTPPVKKSPEITPQDKLLAEAKGKTIEVMRVTSVIPGPVSKEWNQELFTGVNSLKQQLPLLQNKTLHVILQVHHGDMDEELGKTAKESQARVKSELERLTPKLLLLEGSYMPRFSKDEFTEELRVSAEQMTNMFGGALKLSVEKEVAWLIKNSSMLSYALENSECNAVGGELRGPHMLNYIMRSKLVSETVNTKEVAQKLSRLRTLITAGRAALLMQEYKVEEATIVIGLNHAQGFESVCSLFGCKAVLYPTI